MALRPRIFDFRSRLRAALVHLGICAIVAGLAGALVFALWFPWPYRAASGGKDLFILVVSVDLVLGPCLTFTIFNTTKGWRHLGRDLAVIGVLQLAALLYGLHTVYQVRPVALVYEVDRFKVISAAEVNTSELSKASKAYQQLPLTGPWLLGTRAAESGAERNEALFMALNGIDVSQRPQFWQPYDQSKPDALRRSRPINDLLQRYPLAASNVDEVLKRAGLKRSDTRFVPMIARQDWVVLLGPTGDIAGFVPFDGFF